MLNLIPLIFGIVASVVAVTVYIEKPAQTDCLMIDHSEEEAARQRVKESMKGMGEGKDMKNPIDPFFTAR